MQGNASYCVADDQKLTPDTLKEISVFLFASSFPRCHIHIYRYRVALGQLTYPGTLGWTISPPFLERRRRRKCLDSCRHPAWIERVILFTPSCFPPWRIRTCAGSVTSCSKSTFRMSGHLLQWLHPPNSQAESEARQSQFGRIEKTAEESFHSPVYAKEGGYRVFDTEAAHGASSLHSSSFPRIRWNQR